MPHILARELELDNFKSFGRRTIIPFKEGFTTIFGPNGSGKSNIVDSLLFCLGLSTSKTMRAERLPDLINNTSGRKEARVALRLELVDEQKLVEFSRVIRLTKAGYTSTYYLDGHPVTLGDIQHRLSELHISPSGNNVIMQGDVTRLLTMTAMERRKIIDELAGVAEFDARIEDAKVELGKADRHLEDTQLLLTEIQNRVAALATERDNALKYRGYREERSALERLVQYLELQARKKQLAHLEQQIQVRIQERGELELKKTEIEAKIHETAARMSLLQQEIRAKGEEQRVAKIERMEAIKGELARLEDRRGHLQGIVSEKMNRGREVARELDEAKKSLETKSDEITAFQKNLEGIQFQLEGLQKSLEKLHSRIGKINQEHADNITELGRLRGDAQEKRLAEMELRSYQNGLKATLEQNQRSSEETAAACAELETKLQSLEGIRHDGEETRTALKTELDKATTRAELLRRDIVSRRSLLLETGRNLETAWKEHSAAEARSQVAEGGSARGMRILYNAGVRGIRGSVGDLAKIPKEYEAAIDSAAGRRMEFVVVEDEQLGAQCIELLKKQGGGRLTFLPLNKIRADTTLPPFSMQGFLGYAINLIEFDAEYRTIMAYVLGRTVIAKNMNMALPMLGKMRIVTLDGDLLEASGAMTGGSRPQGRPRSAKDDVDAKWNRVKELEQKMEAVKKEVERFEASLTQVAGYQEETRRAVDKLDVELGRDSDEEKRLVSQVTAMKARLADFSDKSRSLQKEIDGSTVELSRLHDEVIEREERLAVLDKTMAGLELADNAAKAHKIDTETRAAEARGLVLKEKVKSLELETEFLKKNIALWQDELDTTEAEILSLRGQIDQTRLAAETLFGEQEKMSGEIAELSDAVKALKAERDELSHAQDKSKEIREGIESRLFRVEGQIAQASREFDQLAEEVDRLDAIDRTLPAVLIQEGETLAGAQGRVAKLSGLMAALEPVNMLAIEQYDELAARHTELSTKLEAVTTEKNELLSRMDQIGKSKFDSFMKAFTGINANFQDIYAQMSAGHGHLVLENPDDPFVGGLIIRAQPKDKKMERMEAMSGGEKSLTALAFVFAFQSFEPAPFYVFDEVDSFLDGPNTERLANLMRSHSEKTQFIVVSHKAAMLERSHRTIGVYQPRNGYTQVKGLELDAFEPASTPSNVTQLPLPPVDLPRQA